MKSYLIYVEPQHAQQVLNELSRVGDVAVFQAVVALQTQSEYDEVEEAVLKIVSENSPFVVAQTIRASGGHGAPVHYLCRLLTP